MTSKQDETHFFGYQGADGQRFEVNGAAIRQLIQNPDKSFGKPKPLMPEQVEIEIVDQGMVRIPLESIRRFIGEDEGGVICQTASHTYSGIIPDAKVKLCVCGFTPDGVELQLALDEFAEYQVFKDQQSLQVWIAEAESIEE